MRKRQRPLPPMLRLYICQQCDNAQQALEFMHRANTGWTIGSKERRALWRAIHALQALWQLVGCAPLMPTYADIHGKPEAQENLDPKNAARNCDANFRSRVENAPQSILSAKTGVCDVDDPATPKSIVASRYHE